MIKAIGIDIVEVKRIKPNFTNFLTQKEIDMMTNFTDHRKKTFIAGRFAVKEAIKKAWSGEMINFNEITILNNEKGEPYVDGYPNLKISISHETNYAVGLCINL